jgi:hypothetical protein
LLHSSKKTPYSQSLGGWNRRSPGCTQGLFERYWGEGTRFPHAPHSGREYGFFGNAEKTILPTPSAEVTRGEREGAASTRSPSSWGSGRCQLRRTFQTPHPNHLARGSMRVSHPRRHAVFDCLLGVVEFSVE